MGLITVTFPITRPIVKPLPFPAFDSLAPLRLLPFPMGLLPYLLRPMFNQPEDPVVYPDNPDIAPADSKVTR